MKTKGFTLIELLVVITIIGILATGATAVYSGAQQKARDSIRENDVAAMSSAMELSASDSTDSTPYATTAAELVVFLATTPEAPSQSDESGSEAYYAVKIESNAKAYNVIACGHTDGLINRDGAIGSTSRPSSPADCTAANEPAAAAWASGTTEGVLKY